MNINRRARQRAHRIALTCLSGITFLAALTACGADSAGVPMHNTKTLEEINTQVDRYVHAIAEKLPNSAKLDENDPTAIRQSDMLCGEQSSEYSANYRYAQRSYPILGLNSADANEIFSSFRKWAAGNGFDVNAADEHRSQNPAVRARNGDGFKVSVDMQYDRWFLSASSPCVWRHGHPEE